MFTVNTFKFLEELKQNNNKAWFELNKSRYEADLLSPHLISLKKSGRSCRKLHLSLRLFPARQAVH